MLLIFAAHVIIPKNVLEAEISHRINCWLFDTSGRKDFSHHYHIEIRKWEMKRKQECKILTDEDALIGEEDTSFISFEKCMK